MSEPIEPLESTGADSAYDPANDETQRSTATITSSIFHYEEENGRTYHAFRAGKYMLPNDDDEILRMDCELVTVLHSSKVNKFSSPQ
jgi:hypothetical protein